MKLLSERLEYEAREFDRDMDECSDGTARLLREAAALAKRYEDAPVRMVGESTSYSASVAGTGIKNGQRVRLVVEGGEG